MRTLQTGNDSRFKALAALARSVCGAPMGPNGAPCVFPELTHKRGRAVLVARTAHKSHDAQLVLADKDPLLLKACLEYFVERLKSIGMMVVTDESQLHAN
jgi:hypothetical protein